LFPHVRLPVLFSVTFNLRQRILIRLPFGNFYLEATRAGSIVGNSLRLLCILHHG